MIIVSFMLLVVVEGMLQETKIITLPIYNTEFRIYNIYISGPPSEEKNPPSSGSAYGLAPPLKKVKKQGEMPLPSHARSHPIKKM